MNSLKTDNSISGYLKETKSHSKLIYRLETGYKNISSLKTRPHTQISAFSQTFTNMPSININKEISEIITKPKTQMTIFIPKVKDKLTQVRPPTESSLKTTKLKNRYKRKNLKCISLEKQQNSFDSKKYYDTVLTDTNPQKKNDNLDSSKLEINQLNSIEIPQKSFVGNLMSSLFRQNNLKSVRNFLVSEKESEIKNAREGNKSPSHSPKIFKGPILAQASSHDKELDVYMNVKNYKLSKNIVNSLKKFCEKILLDRSKKSDQIYVESKITEIYSTLLTHLVNLPSMITECVNKRNNREELFISMALMTAELAQTKDFGLYVEGLKLQAKIYKTYGNLNKSLQIYNQAKQLCNKHDLYKLKTKIYKRLGKLYLELQSLRKAKSNFIKTLELSWFVSSKKYELLAYDLLGLIAFYEGSIEKAKYYHNRMINCELEPENSSIRLIAISKIKNKIDLRKNSENNFTLLGNALVSSDEEEVGLYEIKKKEENYEIYLTPSKILYFNFF